MKTEITKEGQTKINGIILNDKIFQEELHEFELRDKEDFIDNLIYWISECKNNDKYAMKEDLKYLTRLKDKYIFSSILTNKYVAFSDNSTEFNKICKDLIKLNNKFNKCIKCKKNKPTEYEKIGEGKFCLKCLNQENKIYIDELGDKIK